MSRIAFHALAPDVSRAMMQLEKAARQGLDPTLLELIKIRASQLNGCAYCLDMHTRDARAAGETEQRLAVLAAWREAGSIYTDAERAVLALTEAVTLLPGGVPDAVWDAAARHHDEATLAQVVAMIVAINAWNRIAVSTAMCGPAG